MTPRSGITITCTLLSLISCSPQTHKPTTPIDDLAPEPAPVQGGATPPAPHTVVQDPPAVIKPSEPQSFCALQYHHTSRNGIVLSLVSFDDRQYQLHVADQPNGPGSLWQSSGSAAHSHNALASINGGFFTPEGKPLGLLISQGAKRGYINKSSLGAGIYLSSTETSQIVTRQQYQSSPAQWGKLNELLQSGPYLCRKHQTVNGLSSSNQRPRSFIAWDGRHHWAIGHAAACSLKDLSAALAGKAPAGFAIHTALNLDGGRSSDLWVGSKVPGGSQSHRGFLNKNVRNYLVLKPK